MGKKHEPDSGGTRFAITLLFAGVFGFMIVPNILPKTGEASSTTKVTVEIPPVDSTGASVYLGSPTPAAGSDTLYVLDPVTNKIKPQTIPPGWRVTALGDQPGTLVQGTSALSFKANEGWEVVLRTPKGETYNQVHMLGAFDAQHVALSAEQNGTVILLVTKAGELKELFRSSDPMNVLGMSADRVWLSTYQPGEGIELPPQGPSNLIEVDSTGAKATVTKNDHVITNVLAISSNRYAYTRDDGGLTIQATTTQQIDRARALLWLDQDNLLYSRDTSIYRLSLSDGSSTTLGSMPTAPTIGKQAAANDNVVQ